MITKFKQEEIDFFAKKGYIYNERTFHLKKNYIGGSFSAIIPKHNGDIEFFHYDNIGKTEEFELFCDVRALIESEF